MIIAPWEHRGRRLADCPIALGPYALLAVFALQWHDLGYRGKDDWGLHVYFRDWDDDDD